MFNSKINIQSMFLLKKKNFGLGNYQINKAIMGVGLPKIWYNIPFSKKFCTEDVLNFSILKAGQNLVNLIQFNPIYYNTSLRRLVLKHIRILKLNRTLKGLRHLQFLPVRGQRTKTNARTQKNKR